MGWGRRTDEGRLSRTGGTRGRRATQEEEQLSVLAKSMFQKYSRIPRRAQDTNQTKPQGAGRTLSVMRFLWHGPGTSKATFAQSCRAATSGRSSVPPLSGSVPNTPKSAVRPRRAVAALFGVYSAILLMVETHDPARCRCARALAALCRARTREKLLLYCAPYRRPCRRAASREGRGRAPFPRHQVFVFYAGGMYRGSFMISTECAHCTTPWRAARRHRKNSE